MKSLTAIALALALALIPTITLAMSADEFSAHLAKHKWTGTQVPGVRTPSWQGGELDVKFVIVDGKLAGEFTRVTGATVKAEGPLSLVEVSVIKGKPTVSFRSMTGTAFQLSLEADGSLVGDALAGTSKNIVVLRPVAK